MRHPQEIEEYDLGDGYTLIIEWSDVWEMNVGTVQKNGHHDGSILRETVEEIVEVARERRGL